MRWEKKWSRLYEYCQECGEDTKPHHAKGLCAPCHYLKYDKKVKHKIEYYCDGCEKKCLKKTPFTDVLRGDNFQMFKTFKLEVIDKCDEKLDT